MANRDLMFRSIWFFVAAFLTGVSLATVICLIAIRFGGFENPAVIVANALLVAVAVTFPLAALTAQHDYQLRVHRRLLETMASTDPLTGVLNRRTFELAADEQLMRMRRMGRSAAIAVFEVDSFRSLRQSKGQRLADRTLASIAQLAHYELRSPFDRLARWGEDRFVILLADVGVMETRSVCERLRAAVEAYRVDMDGETASTTVSFGFALLAPDGAADNAILAASKALKEARDLGGNTIIGGARLSAVA